MFRLKRRTIAPPGGFRVTVPATGASFTSGSFSELEEQTARHLKANGGLPQDAAEMIDIQTADYLQKHGLTSWITTE